MTMQFEYNDSEFLITAKLISKIKLTDTDFGWMKYWNSLYLINLVCISLLKHDEHKQLSRSHTAEKSSSSPLFACFNITALLVFDIEAVQYRFIDTEELKYWKIFFNNRDVILLAQPDHRARHKSRYFQW